MQAKASQIVKEICQALEFLSIQEKREFFPKFFKAGKGEYAEGDQFLGVTVPDQRKVAKEFWKQISLDDLSFLLHSPIHEHRLTALLMLISKYEKEKIAAERKVLLDFYLAHRKFVNNWDLVDTSCYKILGNYCFSIQDNSIIYNLSVEENMWSKRIAVIATLYFIKQNQFELTKDIVLKNIHHPHDLMHKANGWMLREIGNRNENELITFLNSHYHKMPRTCLRYAIEKLDEPTRQDFLKGRVK